MPCTQHPDALTRVANVQARQGVRGSRYSAGTAQRVCVAVRHMATLMWQACPLLLTGVRHYAHRQAGHLYKHLPPSVPQAVLRLLVCVRTVPRHSERCPATPTSLELPCTPHQERARVCRVPQQGFQRRHWHFTPAPAHVRRHADDAGAGAGRCDPSGGCATAASCQPGAGLSGCHVECWCGFQQR